MRKLPVCVFVCFQPLQILSFSAFVCDCRGKEWDDVDKKEKERIELKKKEDGEFWYVEDNERQQLTNIQPLTNRDTSHNNYLLYQDQC